jgi:hypothetical protein
MRPDFNKQLTERERLGHGMCFHEVRGCKGNRDFDEDAQGGKESMHRRRRETFVERKRFNENLNPLRNFLRVSVGRPWDKVYGEICQNFDKRKVINNHILEHLFDYVETKDLKVVDNVVYLTSRWSGATPIKDSRVEWYVDPRDGILKSGKRPVKVSEKKLIEKARARKIDAVWKVIDYNHHLILQEGIWWVYEVKDEPELVRTWCAPAGVSIWEWRAMSKQDKAINGRWMMVAQPHVSFRPHLPLRIGAGNGRYYSARYQANHKVLKAMGVSGLMAA